MSQHTSVQVDLDDQNAQFWDELCGSAMARELGITDASAESLARFDAAYLDTYPYLSAYLPERLDGQDLLEIGLGYGTLSSTIVTRGANYHGVDIAEGPVGMVRHRLGLAGIASAEERVVRASALDLPHGDFSVDRLYTIGCLHHTGDIPRAVDEVHRVLRPGGTAVVMLYNSHSFRQLFKVELPKVLHRRRSTNEVAALYDTNSAGDAAPHVEYVSRSDVRRIFARFADVQIDVRNFDSTRFFKRGWMLGNVDRLLGLDLYITARK